MPDPQYVTFDLNWIVAPAALACRQEADPAHFATRRLRAAFACRTTTLHVEEIGRKSNLRLYRIVWTVALSTDPDGYAHPETCLAWARQRLEGDLGSRARLKASYRVHDRDRRPRETAAIAAV